ncbi:MAG TPA: PEGA domain-containing protein [Acidobacteriota bacterium]|nr:PEGA domain-containing protein [Acidobacteriota bacterium]HNH82297.1 PEGA domain-containing protein [Acidobacteriota bacterium]
MLVCPKCNAVYNDKLKYCSVDGNLLVPGFPETYLAVGQVLNESLRVVARWRADRLGEVYQAEETFMSGSYVALRLFRPGLITSDIRKALEGLADSIRGMLPDPDVITGYFTVEFTDNRYALVSGYVHGRLLDDIVIQEAPLPPARVVALLLRLTEICANLHQDGWIHGDLTPESIIITGFDETEGYSLKILDYGLARIIAQFGKRSLCGPTGHLAVRNYETYLAPEILGPDPSLITHRADIYSLGALCYHLLSGHLPFFFDQFGITGPVYMTDDPRPLPVLRPELEVPTRLEQLTLRMLSRDPNLRPASMEEINAVLQDLQLEMSLEISKAKTPHSGVRATGMIASVVPQEKANAPTLPELMSPPPGPSAGLSGAGTASASVNLASSGQPVSSENNFPIPIPVPDPSLAPKSKKSNPLNLQTSRIDVQELNQFQASFNDPPTSGGLPRKQSDPLKTVTPPAQSRSSELAGQTEPPPSQPSLPAVPPTVVTPVQSPVVTPAPPTVVSAPIAFTPSPEVKKAISGELDRSSDPGGPRRTGSPATTSGEHRLPPPPVIPNRSSAKSKPTGRPWWLNLAIGGVLLVALSIGAILIFFNRPVPVGTIVIVTDPQGTLIYLDNKLLNPSPTTLKNVPVGPHKLKFVKEGFLELEKEVIVEAGQTLELPVVLQPIRPVLPPGTGTPAERVDEFLRLAEDAFKRTDFVAPENDNALFYADAVLAIQPDNAPASQMRKRINDALAKQAETALNRNDFATSQIAYSQLVEKFPDDPRGAEGMKKVSTMLEQRRGQINEFLASGESAFTSGKLLEPADSSAYFYSAQVIAIDRRNGQALALRNKVKDTVKQQAEQAAQSNNFQLALTQYQKLIRSFPEDKKLAVRLRELEVAKTKAEAAVAAASSPKNLQTQGLQKFRAGNYAEAIPDLEAALSGGISDTETCYALGYAYLKRGQSGNAKRYFTQASQSNPNHGPSLAHLAVLTEQAKDIERAISLYDRAIKAGGGGDYSVAELQQRVDSLRNALSKAKEPSPYSTAVTKEGGFFGSDTPGTLSVSVSGVSFRADKGKDSFSAPLKQVTELRAEGDKLTMKVSGKKHTFRSSSATNFIQTFNACIKFTQTPN